MLKRFFVLFCLLILSVEGRAADSLVVRNKWCRRADTVVTFMGANNVIEVYGKGFKASEAKLKSLDRELRLSTSEVKGDTLITWAMPYAAGRKFRVEVVNKINGRLIKEVNIAGDKQPELRAKIGLINKDTVTKKELMEQYALQVYFPKSLYSYPYHVVSYRFKAKNGKREISLQVNDSIIAMAIMEEIKQLPPNSIVEFTDIKAICPDCEPRMVDDVRLVVQ